MNIIANNSDNSALMFHALFGIFLLAVAGCSGSSNSQSPGETDAVNTSSTSEDPVNETTDSTDVTVDSSTNDSSNDVQDSDAITETPDSVALGPITTEPPVAATTHVSFNISVPAFQSNALQVRLQWGDKDISAAFVVDESWSAVDDFPVDTENELVVTFNDDNGAITLGSFNQLFRTGTNSSETFQITADQFNTGIWDNDSDGVSNINELIAGTDPVSSDTNPVPTGALLPVSASIELITDKTFRIRWQPSSAADFYRVLENPDGVSGFTAVSGELDASTEFYDHRVALHKRVNARYMVEACNSEGCTLSEQQIIEGNLVEAIGYFKASNPGRGDQFGFAVSLSGDGNILAVGAARESSAATGINGDQSDDSMEASGAVYIFTRNDSGWQQQAYIKASNPGPNDFFGNKVRLSADGNTLAVGAFLESSAATGINGDQNDNSAWRSGAVYVFVRNGDIWQQQAYLKASNTDNEDKFGENVSLSADGNTLAVGAIGEASALTGINGDQNNNNEFGSGAVYVFERSNGIWLQQAYIKSSNADIRLFGRGVSLSADGNALAVGGSIQRDDFSLFASEIYMFVRSSGNWQEQELIGFLIGPHPIVSLSGNGKTVAVGVTKMGVLGSATIFENIAGVWQVQATINTLGPTSGGAGESDLSLSADGSTLALGNHKDPYRQSGLQSTSGLRTEQRYGEVNVYTRGDGTWQQLVRVKASNLSAQSFGSSVSLSENGDTLAGAGTDESGSTAGFNGDQTQTGSEFGSSGAVYLY